MQVKDVMTSSVISISPDETVAVAARSLSRNNVGSLPVCTADGKLKGMLTDRDIVLRSVATDENAGSQPVRDIMTRRVITVTPEDPISVAANLMAREQVRRLPVVRGSNLVGMLAMKDLIEAPGMTLSAAQVLEDVSSNIRKP